MILSVIRHGETSHNKNRIMQGHGPVPLSDLGIQQALQAARSLESNPPELIVCSDLCRAIMTGTVLAALTGAPMVYDAGLRERDPGALTGGPYEAALPFFTDPGFEPPEGETFGAFAARIAEAFERIAVDTGRGARHVAVVTHGMIPMAIMHFAFGKAAEECMAMTVANASITTLRYEGGWQLEAFADTAHLTGGGAGRAGG